MVNTDYVDNCSQTNTGSPQGSSASDTTQPMITVRTPLTDEIWSKFLKPRTVPTSFNFAQHKLFFLPWLEDAGKYECNTLKDLENMLWIVGLRFVQR